VDHDVDHAYLKTHTAHGTLMTPPDVIPWFGLARLVLLLWRGYLFLHGVDQYMNARVPSFAKMGARAAAGESGTKQKKGFYISLIDGQPGQP
jgi:hypothetical protein